MVHQPVLTRSAVPADVATIKLLLAELRQVGGRAERAVTPTETDDIEARLTELMRGPDSCIVMAEIDGAVVGTAVMRVIRPDPLSDAQLVQLSRLVVGSGLRHRGVGQALIAATATFAAERHIEHVAVSVYQSMRDASRFYARLGFAPAAVHRVAPVSLLRRRLGADRVLAIAGEPGARRRSRLRRPVPPQRRRRVDRQEV